MKIQISLCQIDIALGQPELNLSKAHHYVSEAASLGSQLIMLPELWTCGYDLSHATQYAYPLGSGVFTQISFLARQFGIAIGGSTLESQGDRLFNTFTIYDAQGQLIAAYRKVHLFRPDQEDRYLVSGDSLTLAQTSFGQAGLATCYDLRFPEMFRALSVMGAQFFLLPAEWPIQRTEHWRALLRARAIENQVGLAAVNRVGTSPDATYGGCSLIVDAWGDTVVDAGSDEGLFTGELDLDQTERIRRKFNVLQDRRPEVY
jgi:predicted amidohydrolase